MKVKFILGLSILIGITFFGYSALINQGKNLSPKQNPTPFPSPTPTPFKPFPYQRPVIEKKRSYITVLAGDSILGYLGKNAQPLREKLNKFYPKNEFVNYNYGFGATNILSLPKRLKSQTDYQGETFIPMLEINSDLVIIGSFAYNPLSEYPLEEGLKIHRQVLDKTIKELIRRKPNSVVALFAPIAPNKENFAIGTYDLSRQKRIEWAEERIAYIENTINYAKDKNIPLINVYKKSLTSNGEANLKYINQDDYIHPSEDGLNLIAQAIAEFIYENKIFPE